MAMDWNEKEVEPGLRLHRLCCIQFFDVCSMGFLKQWRLILGLLCLAVDHVSIYSDAFIILFNDVWARP